MLGGCAPHASQRAIVSAFTTHKCDNLLTYITKNFVRDIVLHKIQDLELATPSLGTLLRTLLLSFPIILGPAWLLLRLVATLDEKISNFVRRVLDSIIVDL